ncbi:uncharacterized protein BCR38DRAFT_527229 [Pseudomassariella vexata]|uniref:Heterokaryon incompatibility domain-containing protein n=1 Tax=Pseudomassariella vexata TaxID=1141098 RepID=A0A1Y2DJE9_9PEZI|nr:uncharacterized protein BCR38DRAFT_527229 [Pseudomassariella vexata]ORY59284.1 hypothetical protein BCR38DRAFT_527229 [Pseudomassariella vexata]
MEHIAVNHGASIEAWVRVQCQTDLLKGQLSPPENFEEFYSFPENCGWKVGNDFKIQPLGKGKQTNLAVFLQGWLFFGLAFTVVQEGGKPNMGLKDLTTSTYLSTRCLNKKLDAWSTWEKKNLDGLKFRMIQVGWALDLARQVLRKNCAYINDRVEYDDDIEDPLHIDDKHALVLMCLGETLSEAKANIMASQGARVKLDGWHADDHAGWGPPRFVFQAMTKDGWCRRAMQLLKGQLSSNATMLIAAYYAYHGSSRMDENHEKCTAEECRFNPKDYTKHILTCTNCDPLGPSQEAIMQILEEDGDDIPLLHFRKDPFRLEVVRFRPKEDDDKIDFVAISHVWSDGWGNEDKNELYTCQLQFIQRQIQRAIGPETSDVPFWMDTLIVPVGPSVKQHLKRKAIRQIFEVFEKSKYTIVLDNGLKAMNRGKPDNPAEAAMRILSSVWMRRLWTLQEAYLSRQILIPFEEGEKNTNNLVALDALEGELRRVTEGPTSGVIRLIKDHLSHIMMGEERQYRKNGLGDFLKKNPANAATVVANAWRAARWRSTSKAEHEVLALATLLNLNYKNTEIENAGLIDPSQGKGRRVPDGLEKLAVEFWNLVQQQYNGSIPSGMIFLPGEKLNCKGFGWAPKTWLSAHEINYPDPLKVWKQATVLDRANGLKVQYPGFLLYPDSTKTRGHILGTTVKTDFKGREAKFSFPVDRSLNEWYSFKPADERNSDQLDRLQAAESTLAIILSGPQPREWPREIALLVEVVGENSEAQGGRETLVYHTHIIRRVLIWREASYLNTDRERLRCKSGVFQDSGERNVCLGEMLGPTQSWWVDGYVTKPNLPMEEDMTDMNDQEDLSDMSRKHQMVYNQRSNIVMSLLGWVTWPRQDATPQSMPNRELEEVPQHEWTTPSVIMSGTAIGRRLYHTLTM